MSEQSQQGSIVGGAGDQDVVGSTDHEQHRGEAGEGSRAPLAAEGADHSEMSIYDGMGNESVVVITEDDEGKVSEGTGATSAEAMKDAKKPGEYIGDAFNPDH
jgi:hypothetical protein